MIELIEIREMKQMLEDLKEARTKMFSDFAKIVGILDQHRVGVPEGEVILKREFAEKRFREMFSEVRSRWLDHENQASEGEGENERT